MIILFFLKKAFQSFMSFYSKGRSHKQVLLRGSISSKPKQTCCRLQCLEILLRAHQMMKTEVCSRGAPRGIWQLLGMSNFTTTPQSMTANTFPVLASKHKLASLPSLRITGSLPETKPQTEETSHDYTTEITVVFLLDFISCRQCSRLIYNHKRLLPLLV